MNKPKFLGAAFVCAWFQQPRCDQDYTMGWKPLQVGDAGTVEKHLQWGYEPPNIRIFYNQI